jgi:hypothetical protein
MQENRLFEYAVIRVVPRVEREEFLNVGVILYCRDADFLDSRCHLDEARLRAFSQDIDLNEVKQHLQAICDICKGSHNSGAIGKLELHERFRWLTAMRSTVVQTSRVHPGFCADPAGKMKQLFEELCK